MKSKFRFQDEAKAIACFALMQGYFAELPLAKLADLSPNLTPLSEDDVIGLMKGASIAIENIWPSRSWSRRSTGERSSYTSSPMRTTGRRYELQLGHGKRGLIARKVRTCPE